jgi:aminoglycoside phosphotransferase family enzyme
MSELQVPTALPSFDSRLHFLQQALAPRRPGARADLIETHLSWVVLGADRVLKMKKPGGHPVIDLSLPEVRRRNAHEEVRLNRRLAPDVYLGVLALEWRAGAFALVPDEADRPGEAAIDWLVHMRRLPAALMLDELVRRRQFGPDQLGPLAATLAAFHAGARRVALGGTEYVRRIVDEQRANRRVLEDSRVAVAGAAAAIDRFEDVVARQSGTLGRRAREGRIVEGHGDLRPEHVCMLSPPVVIDCLEFDATLRELDPLDEIAFLALEVDLLGPGGIGRELWRRFQQVPCDPAAEDLRQLYTARRALLRARLVAAHLLDAGVANPASWRARAYRYVAIANAATQRLAAAAAGERGLP